MFTYISLQEELILSVYEPFKNKTDIYLNIYLYVLAIPYFAM